MDTLSIPETIKALKDCNKVFVYSCITNDDGYFIEAKKVSVLRHLNKMEKGINIKAFLQDDGRLFLG